MKSLFKISVTFLLLITTSILYGQTTYTDFNAGAAIIDMGKSTQTVNNGLKPYGLVVDLVDNGIPVNWIINPAKTFGVDPFTKVDEADIIITATINSDPNSASVTNYQCKAGPFLVAAE